MQRIRTPGLAACLTAILLAACATQRDTATDPVGRYEVSKELETGQIRLGCDWSCTASWGGARKTALGLYRSQLWNDLAAEVVRVGYGSDLTYFYLARAAEGLGKNSAAAVYYRLALAAGNRCDGLVFNSCDGLDVNPQIQAGLKRLSP
jgi:hypothetical protein